MERHSMGDALVVHDFEHARVFLWKANLIQRHADNLVLDTIEITEFEATVGKLSIPTDPAQQLMDGLHVGILKSDATPTWSGVEIRNRRDSYM
jgi:hypothetical protein